MKNIDSFLSRYRQPPHSPPHSKKYPIISYRKSAEVRDIYRSKSRKPNRPRDIYIKNIIASPNIVNIHTTTIQFEGGNRKQSSQEDPILPRTVTLRLSQEKYRSSRRFDFNGSGHLSKYKHPLGKI